MKAYIFTGGEIFHQYIEERPEEGDLVISADAGYTDAIAQVVEPNAASIERGYVFGGTASVAESVLDALAAATK